MRKLEGELAKMVFVVVPMVLQPLLNFCFLLLVARASSLEIYGSLALCIVLVSIIVGFSDLGLRDYLLSKPAVDRGLSSGENLFFPSTMVYLILAAGTVAYLQFIGGNDLGYYLLLASLPEAFALGVLQKSLFFHYQKQDRLVSFSSIDALHRSLPFGLKIFLYWLTNDIVMSVLVGSLVTLISYVFWFNFQCVRPPGFFSNGARPVTTLMLIITRWRSWTPFTISFLSFFLYFGADRILIDAFLGSEALAIFAAAYSFIALGQIVVTAFWSLFMPRISSGSAVYSKRGFLFLATGMSAVIFLGYQVFAAYLFGYIYPESFSEASVVLALMSSFFIFRLINVVFEMHWIAADRYSTFVKMRVGCGVLSVTLNALLIPVYGLLAPALIVVVAEAILLVLILCSEWRWHRTAGVLTSFDAVKPG
ncbi:oligosaccharide flippase family protein [Halopseudomonas sp.]|uniref:oligosaccharide flippase family protein n=1 Tax=Halopseudomonas sp. TaxID=2901191 RepID=UPI0039E42A64